MRRETASETLVGRRMLLGGVMAAASLTLVPRRAHARERRILLMGSSTMAGALGGLLEHGLRGLGFDTHRRPRSASSLSRPDFFDWFAEASRLRDAFRPDAAIIMFAANDAQAIYTGEESKWIQFHEKEAWTRAYRERVNRIVDIVAPRGQPVVWIGAPIMRSRELSRRMKRVNRIYREEMAWRPAATFIETWSLLTDRAGNYADKIRIDGTTKLVRAPDGVHIARQGAEVVADRVLGRAAKFLHEKPRPHSRPSDLSCAGRHARFG